MPLRKITINKQIFLWKREHIHVTNFELSPCVEKITIYLEGNKKAPLRLIFKDDDNKLLNTTIDSEKWCLTGSGDGIVWYYKQSPFPATENTAINFNRPQVIKEFILYFLNNGWKPEQNDRPFEITEALNYLDKIELTREEL